MHKTRGAKIKFQLGTIGDVRWHLTEWLDMRVVSLTSHYGKSTLLQQKNGKASGMAGAGGPCFQVRYMPATGTLGGPWRTLASQAH